MLGGFCLDLVRGFQIGHQGQVHEQGLSAIFRTELPDRFKERQRFNITHRTTDLYHGDIKTLGGFHDVLFDLISNMRNHLDGTTKIVTTAFAGDDVIVDAAGSEIIQLAHTRADKSLVVTKIEVGFSTVLGHINLTVLERTHGARINIDVGVKLDHGDFHTACFKYGGQ